MEILHSIGEKIGFDWRLSLTHLINFLIIFFLLVKFALPKIKATIDERTKKIKEGLLMRESADKIVADATTESKQIGKNANAKYEEVVSKADAEAKNIVKGAHDNANDIIKLAEKERGEAFAKGLESAENIVKKDIANIINKIALESFDKKIDAEVNDSFVSSIFKQNYGK